MSRLSKLEARRSDPTVLLAKRVQEAFREIEGSESVKYAVGTMQPIDSQYTLNTFAQGDRVKNQLVRHLPQDCEFRYQGSTTNDTHIRARSDIDLLTILAGWWWLEPPLEPESRYEGDPKADISDLHRDAARSLASAFPEASVDSTGSTAIVIEGGSLSRVVDVVPATWYNTVRYASTFDEKHRGVKVFDRAANKFVANTPFWHNYLINQRDIETEGGMRKAARLMKSLKYDATPELDISSYNIVSIAYSIPIAQLHLCIPLELNIVEICYRHCRMLVDSELARDSLLVPDGSRRIFGTDRGCASEQQLLALTRELFDLRQSILRENTNHFVRLADARVYYPLSA